jgi:AraC family transcriptional regulator of adaptative response / DNA-3-methyladenine glycosylase II
LVLHLPTRTPWDAEGTLAFLSRRALDGVEDVSEPGRYRRGVATPHGHCVLEAWPETGRLAVRLHLFELSSLPFAVDGVRRLFDLDADPVAVDDVLGRDPVLAPLVRDRPGVRVPGAVDGFELAVRAVVGQQVSVGGARTLLTRLVARCGEPLPDDGGPRLLFPTPSRVLDADLAGLGLTRARVACLRALASGHVGGRLDLRPGADLAAQRRELLDTPGVGPWTAEYVALRALGDPDAFPATDLVLRRAVGELQAAPGRWRPWRGYGALHLWLAAGAAAPVVDRPAPARTRTPTPTLEDAL